MGKGSQVRRIADTDRDQLCWLFISNRYGTNSPMETFFLSVCWINDFGRSGSVGSVCFWASRILIHYEVRIRILLSSSKNSKKNLDSYCFVTSFLLPSWWSLTKIAGSGSRAGSGSVSQRCWSAGIEHSYLIWCAQVCQAALQYLSIMRRRPVIDLTTLRHMLRQDTVLLEQKKKFKQIYLAISN
jgi:hypothetical protein